MLGYKHVRMSVNVKTMLIASIAVCAALPISANKAGPVERLVVLNRTFGERAMQSAVSRVASMRQSTAAGPYVDAPPFQSDDIIRIGALEIMPMSLTSDESEQLEKSQAVNYIVPEHVVTVESHTALPSLLSSITASATHTSWLDTNTDGWY
jgi:hypothetical protein